VNAREVLARAAPWLAAKGSPSPRLDAELLLASVLGVPRLALFTDLDRPLVEAEVAAFRGLLLRRGALEPVAYLTGRREFYGLEFEVGPGVFIPRPETELLVDRARELVPRRVLDLGTGSGCIAVACAVRLPECEVVAVERSPAALEIARRNAARHGVTARVRLLSGDFFDALVGEAPFDLVATNPPYVPDGEARTVAAFEPAEALYAGPLGLDAILRILREAPRHLVPGGTLLVEIGETQERAVLDAAGSYEGARVHRDLAGLPRVFEGRRPAAS
jgi:release factor glutamine methyltransferase